MHIGLRTAINTKFITAAGLFLLLASSQPAKATIIIDAFSTSSNANVTITDPGLLPITFTPNGVATASAIGGARIMGSYVTEGSEEDQYRLRVSNATGKASVETSALVVGKGMITYNGTTNAVTTLTGGNFNAPAAFNLNGGLGYDLTEGGANATFIINGYADNNGIPMIVTVWTDATHYARGTLNMPGSTNGLLVSHFLHFSDFVVTGGGSVTSVLASAKAITLELNGTNPSVTPGTDVVLDYFIATAIPEPASFALMGGSLLAFGLIRRRVKR